MTREPNEPFFIEIKETLVGRKAGGGASEKAREDRAAHPLGTLAARLLGKHTDERAWRRGARGEGFVGWYLGRLPEGWYVFNDIPVGERGANIDHVVVGPAGVFTVNTKNLTGKVWVGPHTLLHNGHRTDFLPKAVEEARRASRLLAAALGRPVEVRPVLAIMADDWTIKERPTDVFVGGPRAVKRWLLEHPQTLTARQVIDIQGAAAKPSTWVPERSRPKGNATARKSPRAEAAEPDVGVARPCPCGGEMVLRTRRSDGAPFLGCSRFPKCRRTWQIP